LLAGLAEPKVRFQYPTADEQTVLSGMTVRLLERPQEIKRCDQLLTGHYYHQVKRWRHEQRESTTVGSPIRIAAAAPPSGQSHAGFCRIGFRVQLPTEL